MKFLKNLVPVPVPGPVPVPVKILVPARVPVPVENLVPVNHYTLPSSARARLTPILQGSCSSGC